MPNFLLASHIDPNSSSFASEKCLGVALRSFTTYCSHIEQVPLFNSFLFYYCTPRCSPPSALTALINFQTLICQVKCVVSPPLVTPSSATAFLSSPLGGQREQGVRQGHGNAARKAGVRRRVGQVSSEKKKTAVFERWSSLAASSSLPRSFLKLFLSSYIPLLFFPFPPPFSQTVMLSPPHTHSQTSHPSSITVPKSLQCERQAGRQAFTFWPHLMRAHSQSVPHCSISFNTHTDIYQITLEHRNWACAHKAWCVGN